MFLDKNGGHAINLLQSPRDCETDCACAYHGMRKIGIMPCCAGEEASMAS